MTENFERYAVYYAPERGSELARLGNQWLGFNPETGGFLKRPLTGKKDVAEIEAITKSPSRYGFHGTLKPPFYMTEGRSVDELDLALELLARNTASFDIEGLSLQSLDGFLALVPSRQESALLDLANACVANLDVFRKSPSDAELARRRKNLSDIQKNLLLKWGYPYVFGEFRFHLTLTERLKSPLREDVMVELAEIFAPVLNRPVGIKEICLFGDPGGKKPFRLIRRYPLAG